MLLPHVTVLRVAEAGSEIEGQCEGIHQVHCPSPTACLCMRPEPWPTGSTSNLGERHRWVRTGEYPESAQAEKR